MAATSSATAFGLLPSNSSASVRISPSIRCKRNSESADRASSISESMTATSPTVTPDDPRIVAIAKSIHAVASCPAMCNWPAITSSRTEASAARKAAIARASTPGPTPLSTASTWRSQATCLRTSAADTAAPAPAIADAVRLTVSRSAALARTSSAALLDPTGSFIGFRVGVSPIPSFWSMTDQLVLMLDSSTDAEHSAMRIANVVKGDMLMVCALAVKATPSRSKSVDPPVTRSVPPCAVIVIGSAAPGGISTS